MSSPAAEPITDAPVDAPSQPAPAPARRTLFKNRRPKVIKTAEEEAADAVDFFSRSKEVFPKAIQEQKEKWERDERRKRQEEEERRRRREEKERSEREIVEERKQRRYVLDGEGSADEFIGDRREKREKSRSYSRSRSVTPPLHRSQSIESLTNPTRTSTSPPEKRRSPRNERTTRSKRPNTNVISLSSSEDDDEDIKLAKHRSLATDMGGDYENAIGYDEFASSPPRTVSPRRRSPSIEEIPAEEEIMFPELVAQARAREAAEKAAKLKAMLSRTKSASSNGSGSPGNVDGVDSPLPLVSSPLATRDLAKEDTIISIFVSSRVDGLGEAIVVKRKLSQRFKDVRMAWCDKQIIQGYRPMSDIEKETIFLSWRERKVWDVTTAESLGIRVDGRGHVVDEKGLDLGGNLHLEAWTQETFDAFQKEKKREKARAAMGAAERIDLDEEEAQEQVESSPQQSQIAKIRIVLKGKEGEPVRLIVKTTTAVAAIVNGFKVQRAALCEGKTVELWFDGDRLEEDSTVGEADVDDMSTIDVVLK